MPVKLARSLPNPDLVVARGTILDYATTHPEPQAVLLLIEVSNTTLQFDLGKKAMVYARDEIDDYWVVDVGNRQLHVFRQAIAGNYSQHLILDAEETISPLHFPGWVFKVADMLL